MVDTSKIPVIKANGALYIGDLHTTSTRPGRRIDDYTTSTLEELSYALKLAQRKNLVPIFLGDIFHDAVEEDEATKSRLMQVMMEYLGIKITAIGNHDKTHDKLSLGDSLSLFFNSMILHDTRAGGPACVISGGGINIGIYICHHGSEIPNSVVGAFGDLQVDSVVVITHADLAFEGAYPGSKPIHPIDGCHLVVNGHMHLYKDPVEAGDTVWFNPGAIARVSIDAALHEPTAWEMNMLEGCSLVPHVIPHRKDVFDLTGRLIAPDEVEIKHEDKTSFDSAFASLLSNEHLDPKSFDDATLLREEINSRMTSANLSDGAKLVLMELVSATE